MRFHKRLDLTWDEAIKEVGMPQPFAGSQYLPAGPGRRDQVKKEVVEFDVAVAPFLVTSKRGKLADFSRTVKTVGYRVAVLRPKQQSPGIWQFLEPFTWQLWLITASFFILSGFIICLLERKRKTYPAGSPGPIDSMFVSTSTLFYTHDQDSVLSESGKSYIAVMCFVVLILCACFTANLSVFLLKEHEPSTFKFLSDLENHLVGVPAVTGALEYMKQTYLHLDITFIDAPPDRAMEMLTSKNITAFVGDASILEFEVRSNCLIQLLEEKLRSKRSAAFALRRGSVYKDKLDQGILEAWDRDFVEQLEQKYFEWADECQNYGQVAADEPLELQHLGGLFIIFVSSAVICLAGDLVLRLMYKQGIMQPTLDPQIAGVNATATRIKAAVHMDIATDITLSKGSAASLRSFSGTTAQQ